MKSEFYEPLKYYDPFIERESPLDEVSAEKKEKRTKRENFKDNYI